MEATLGSRPRVYFEVEKVIGISSDGSYQVQWAPAWVSKFQLAGCEHLIEEFLQQQSQKKNGPELPPMSSEVEQHTLKINSLSLTNGTGSAVASHFTQYECQQLSVGQAEVDSPQVQPLIIELQSKSQNHISKSNSVANLSSEDPSLNDVQLNPVVVDVKVEEGDETFASEEPASLISSHLSASSYSMVLREYADIPSTSTDTYPLPIRRTMDIPEAGDSDSGIMPITRQYMVHRHNESSSSKKRNSNKQFMVQVENEPCVCRQCNKTFDQITALKQHLRTHNRDSRYACSYCTSTFTNSHNLKQHLRTHTGEKPFTCEHCGKSFRVKSHLTDHRRIHTGSKPYVCDVCGKTFAQSSHRNQHMRRCTSTT